jgi:hypothetical protein
MEPAGAGALLIMEADRYPGTGCSPGAAWRSPNHEHFCIKHSAYQNGIPEFATTYFGAGGWRHQEIEILGLPGSGFLEILEPAGSISLRDVT